MSSLKRISAPRTYHILRKKFTWVTKPNPGPHDKNALSLNVVIRDVLKLSRKAREVKRMLNEGKVLVDGVVRRNPKLPVGLFDIISIPLIKKHYRVVLDSNGRLVCKEAKSKESELKLVRVKNKKRLAKNYQLTTNDGRSIIVKLSDGKKIKTGYSLLIKVPSQEIVKVLPLMKDYQCFITGGAHVGKKAVINDVNDKVIVINIDGKEYRTIKDYVFVIGDKSVEVSL